jgi:hypothetical protein
MLEILYLASFERNPQQHRETENSCANNSYTSQILKYVVLWLCHRVFIRVTLNRDICNKQYFYCEFSISQAVRGRDG